VGDYYLRYIKIAHLTSMTSAHTILKLKYMIAHWDIPDDIVTNVNLYGTQFSSDEFRIFAETYGFGHTTSSPCQLIMGRQIQTGIPTLETKSSPVAHQEGNRAE